MLFLEIQVNSKIEIMHETFSFQGVLYSTNKIRLAPSVYRKAWNEYTIYTKSNSFLSNIDGTVGCKDLYWFLNWWWHMAF